MASRLEFFVLVLLVVCVAANDGEDYDVTSSFERIFRSGEAIDPKETLDMLIKLSNATDVLDMKEREQVRRIVLASQTSSIKCGVTNLTDLDDLKGELLNPSAALACVGYYQLEQVKKCREIVIHQFAVAEGIFSEETTEKVKHLAANVFNESNEPGVNLSEIITRDKLVYELANYMSQTKSENGSGRKSYKRKFDTILYEPCHSFYTVVQSYLPLAGYLSTDAEFANSISSQMKAATICGAICEARNSIMADSFKILRGPDSEKSFFSRLRQIMSFD